MDFISASFPESKVHIALFQLPQSDTVEFPDKRSERKAHLQNIAKTHQHSLAIINVQFVASLMHLNIAAARALVN